MSSFAFNANRKGHEEDIDDFIKRKSTNTANPVFPYLTSGNLNSKDISPIKTDSERGYKSSSQQGTPQKGSEISPVKRVDLDSAFTTSNHYFTTTSPTKNSNLSVHFQDSDKKSFKSIESGEIARDNGVLSLASPQEAQEHVLRKGAIFTKSPNPTLDFNRKDARRSNENSASPRFSKSNTRSPLAESRGRDSKSQNHRSQPNSRGSSQSNASNDPQKSALKKSSISEYYVKKDSLTMTFRKDQDQYSDSSKKYSANDKLNTSLTWDHASEHTISPNNLNNRSFQFPAIPKLAMEKVAGTAPRSRNTTTRSAKLETIYSARTDFLVATPITSTGVLPNSVDCLMDPTEEIIKDLKKRREKYSDSLFKPSLTSLVNSTKQHRNSEWAGFQWRRLGEIYKGIKTYLTQEVSPTQIEPGTLKDHAVISALALLAENPDIIKSLFANQYFNEEGCYAVKLCKDGNWMYCLVDDFVPVLIDKQGTINPAFARCSQGKRKHIDFWPILLEKAWAKTFHTYENIESCEPSQILRDLTGAPCNTVEINDSFIWNVLTNALSDGSLILAVPKNDENVYNHCNLNQKFGRAVLGTFTLNKRGEKVKLIKIRNLWSDDQPWQGQWHYKSDLWIPEMKQEILIDKCIEEKAVFLSPEEFSSCFQSIEILRYLPAYKYHSVAIRHARLGHSIAKFKVTKDLNCFIEVTQVDKTFYRGSIEYNYAMVRIMVGRQNEDGTLEYLVGHYGNSKYTEIKLGLGPGEYYVFVMAEWGNQILDLNLSTYAEEELTLEKVPYKQSLLSDMLQEYIGMSFPPTVLDHNKDFKRFSLEFAELKMIAEVYRNDSKERRLSMRRSLGDMRMCTYLNFKVENSAFDMNVEGGTGLLLLFGKTI